MTNRQESAAALRWFRWVKKRGDAKARSQVGWILEFEATNKQASAAVLWYFKWMKRMSKQGNAEAQYRVGQIFDVGRRGSVCVDDAEEVKWWRKAAEQGHLEAQLALGWEYYYVYRNERDALPFHRMDKYEVDEAYNMAEAVEAVKWFRKAAEQGDEVAQSQLGDMYIIGEGVVPEDDEEAMKRLRKAAEQGHGWSQFWLGLMYYDGRGVPRDDVEAAKWMRKAAEQGDGWAREQLGDMYCNGEGVEKDEVEGYAWLLLAEEDAGLIFDHEDLEKRLTVEQGKKAQARAAELRRLYSKQSER